MFLISCALAGSETPICSRVRKRLERNDNITATGSVLEREKHQLAPLWFGAVRQTRAIVEIQTLAVHGIARANGCSGAPR